MSNSAVLPAKADQDLFFVRFMNIISRYFAVRRAGMGGVCSKYEGKSYVYRVVVGKPEGKRPLGRPRLR
jgi:hypothetical protein